MQKNITSFDGTVINYDISKKGNEWLVFLHGAGGDLSAWEKERVFFHKKGYSTLAIDLRGHGKSGRPSKAKDYTLESFCKDVGVVIQHENIKDFVLIGHCFGGMVTLFFHTLFPSLSKSYILIDTTYKAPQILNHLIKHNPFLVNLLNRILEVRDKKSFTHANYEQFVGTTDYDLKRILSDITHTSLKSWVFTFEMISGFDATDTLKNINKPVLIIHGEDDSVFDVSVAKRMQGMIHDSLLSIIPKGNHIVVLNNPRDIESKIYGFIKGNKNSAETTYT